MIAVEQQHPQRHRIYGWMHGRIGHHSHIHVHTQASCFHSSSIETMRLICRNNSRGGSTKRRRRKTLLSNTFGQFVVWVLLLVPAAVAAATPLRINEFLASNQNSGYVDFEGGAEDWIELYNDGNLPINLAGYALTDDASMWNKWTFPTGTSIPSKSYLMIFASEKGGVVDTGDELHTNFKLKADGEYLGLFDTTGTVVSDFTPKFPSQTADVSYGYDITGNALEFFSTPTPNGPNVVGGGGIPPPVQFSVSRGFYTIPFNLVLTATPVTLQIRYTLDGSKPTATSGILYTGPIAITTTSIVRATSFGANYLPEPKIPTHTYIFLGAYNRSRWSVAVLLLIQPAKRPCFLDGDFPCVLPNIIV
jgi:hypothetical protein